MSNKEKTPSMSKVSTGCSKIKSCLSLCRPAPQPAPSALIGNFHEQKQQSASYSTAPLASSNRTSTSSLHQAYSERVQEMEIELAKLKKGLSTKKQEAGNQKNTVVREAQGHINGKLIRLVDGSYLYEVKKVGNPWKRLAVQLSSPMIVDDVSTANQVIRAMASMQIEDLYRCLVESMPMGDIRGYDVSKIQERTVMQGSEDGFAEAVVLGAMGKIEGLVMEGLKIQMSSTKRGPTGMKKINNEKTREGAVLIMLIRIRDPEESYETVGEHMVALIEVSAAEMADKKYHTEGVHVAGIRWATTRNAEEHYIWSASVEGCNNYVRNPDIYFAT